MGTVNLDAVPEMCGEKNIASNCAVRACIVEQTFVTSIFQSFLFGVSMDWLRNTATLLISSNRTALLKNAQTDQVCAKAKNLAAEFTQPDGFSRLMAVPEVAAEVRPSIKILCSVAKQILLSWSVKKIYII